MTLVLVLASLLALASLAPFLGTAGATTPLMRKGGHS
jgi:hypothetical protein